MSSELKYVVWRKWNICSIRMHIASWGTQGEIIDDGNGNVADETGQNRLSREGRAEGHKAKLEGKHGRAGS